MSDALHKKRKYRSVLYISHDFQLYLGSLNLTDNEPSSPPQVFATSIEGGLNMRLPAGEAHNVHSMFCHHGVKRSLTLDGFYAYLILEPGNPYGHILQNRMTPLANDLYVNIDEINAFQSVFKTVLLQKPPIAEVKQYLDELIINEQHRFYVDNMVDKRVLSIMNVIKQDPIRTFTVEELAQTIHLSPSRLMGLFKGETGMTIGQYNALRKLIYAYYLIAKGQNLSQAAKTAGFYDDSHLAKTSKKFIGILPSTLFSADTSTELIGTIDF